MSYQQVLDNLGTTTERTLLALLADHRAGRLTLDQFTRMGAVVIATAQEQGRYAAELSMLSWLRTVDPDAVPVAAPAVPHYQDSGRLAKAVETIAVTSADELAAATRLGRLAYAETVEASQVGFQQAMIRSGTATGWVRGLEPKACELCVWWHRGGRVWPTTYRMPVHKGCTCTMIPTTEAAQPVPHSRQYRRGSGAAKNRTRGLNDD